jgi:uncharacterized protein
VVNLLLLIAPKTHREVKFRILFEPHGPADYRVSVRSQRKPFLHGNFLSLLTIALELMMLGGCADQFLLHPSRHPIPFKSSERFEVPINGGSIDICKARWPQDVVEQPQAFVLVFTGNATRAEQVAEPAAHRWRGAHAQIWAMNYPGFGKTTGEPHLADIPPAVLAVYDAAAKQANGRPIFVDGTSLGTTAAIYLATQRPVKGMVLTNPPPLRQLVLQRYGWWNLWLGAGAIVWSIPPELDTLTNGPHCTAPAIFIMSDQDELVPPKYHQMVFNAYGGLKSQIHLPDADHNTGPTDEEEKVIETAINRWWAVISLHGSAG